MYQLIKSIELDPTLDSQTVEQLEVAVLWGSTILKVDYISPTQDYVLTTATFPAEVLGSDSLLIVDKGLFQPKTKLGDFTIQVKKVFAPTPLPRAKKKDRRFIGTFIGCLLAAIASIGTMNYAIAEDSSLLSHTTSEERLFELRRYMALQPVREPEVVNTNHNSNQSTDSSRGYSVQVNRGARVLSRQPTNTPTSYRLTPTTSREIAGRSGIFAALGGRAMEQGTSGIVTPFGNMTDGNIDTISASDGIGNEFGSMGSLNTGWGGGPSGEQTVNIGSLNTIGNSGNRQLIGNHIGGSLGNRRTTGPIVRARAPEVTGLLPQEAIRRVVVRNIGQINHCYEQGLATNPELSGRVIVRFVIGGTGTVMGSSIVESNLIVRTVEECMAGVVRRWQFPAPEGAGIVTVNYPFNLQTVN
jgi:hypothetical protein